MESWATAYISEEVGTELARTARRLNLGCYRHMNVYWALAVLMPYAGWRVLLGGEPPDASE